MQAQILFEALQLAEHCIKTGFGVSEPAYGPEDDMPLMGVGQGNGLGGCVWTLISSKLIEVMKKRGHGVKFRSSLSLTLITIAAFAYVDDTDLPMMAPNVNDTGEDIREAFQNQLDDWSKLLVASGGELDPNKSNCYIIDFEWNGNNWEYRKIENMPGNYTLLDKEGNRHPLARHEVSKATETLGVFIAMDGNSEAQKLALEA